MAAVGLEGLPLFDAHCHLQVAWSLTEPGALGARPPRPLAEERWGASKWGFCGNGFPPIPPEAGQSPRVSSSSPPLTGQGGRRAGAGPPAAPLPGGRAQGLQGAGRAATELQWNPRGGLAAGGGPAKDAVRKCMRNPWTTA